MPILKSEGKLSDWQSNRFFRYLYPANTLPPVIRHGRTTATKDRQMHFVADRAGLPEMQKR